MKPQPQLHVPPLVMHGQTALVRLQLQPPPVAEAPSIPAEIGKSRKRESRTKMYRKWQTAAWSVSRCCVGKWRRDEAIMESKVQQEFF